MFRNIISSFSIISHPYFLCLLFPIVFVENSFWAEQMICPYRKFSSEQDVEEAAGQCVSLSESSIRIHCITLPVITPPSLTLAHVSFKISRQRLMSLDGMPRLVALNNSFLSGVLYTYRKSTWVFSRICLGVNILCWSIGIGIILLWSPLSNWLKNSSHLLKGSSFSLINRALSYRENSKFLDLNGAFCHIKHGQFDRPL